jgi:predicted transcriptional regulator
MKTAVSIPNPLFEGAERTARRLGLSRSALYARALADFITAQRQQGITEALNAVYAAEPSSLDPALAAMQAASLGPDEW